MRNKKNHEKSYQNEFQKLANMKIAIIMKQHTFKLLVIQVACVELDLYIHL